MDLIVPTLATLYLAVLLVKAAAVLWVMRGERIRPARTAVAGPADVAILQPILGGDAHLQEVLMANVQVLPQAHFIWLLDADDIPGNAAADAVIAQHPQVRIARVQVPPAPAGINPKAWKLDYALPHITARVSLILDDDAHLSGRALSQLLLDLTHADVVTALPYYCDSDTVAGRLLAQFVNNNAALTYLGWLLFAAPLTINGMCYAVRTEQLRSWGGFSSLLTQLTDDLAFATLVRERGGRLWQSIAPVAMRTAIPDLPAYVRQMHRWMLFALILLRRQRLGVRSAIGVLQGLPPVLLLTMLMCACMQHSWPAALSVLIVLLLRALLLCGVQWRVAGAVRHRVLLSIIVECLQPLHLLHAALVRTIRWRTRRYRVLSNGCFRAE
ncbi:glycosyltransferase family 2 protein [Xanthomonas vasicola]|uniref:glycosyltransferase family 2 protein n=1 Tax=Xanthomonas vasicola TaxID=56459 RepID=UPI0001CBF32F|nr:glycosyltransferase [Xanthomonas vasicola]KFA30165.1 ceramide glucosyltransferase [Xanthomonas vasicola pv. musacearum NCPPB 4384]AZR26895.1 ceramide glucosyltransferase [Xanthomonas vasicola pv. arecae]AZR31317.1 ceramide glucosyltransferase [Xanthomonas vasicola pv. musacearum NCPPB 4379]AZR34618.1 ceramide glucosyltransferase [Xanthomonas vasicola]KFA12990.1 ceramide glucosyltransferase [Xanthomonas vasicola pv. musacearum NCPPB 4380]